MLPPSQTMQLPVTNDARVAQQVFDLGLVIRGDRGRIEVIKGFPVILSFAQDGHPAQHGLGTVQDQVLEQAALVVFRQAPFFIMVFLHQRVVSGPFTADCH
jgi:hypothetical protein